MTRTYKLWSAAELRDLAEQLERGTSRAELMARYSVSYGSLDHQVNRIRSQQQAAMEPAAIIHESIYPRYTEPLVYEGDALILPDLEAPFHHAGFVNRCLSLANAWKIPHCVVAGDALHFASLSAWEPAWSLDQLDELAGPNLGMELRIASKTLQALAEQFDSVDLILGNHEGRLIRVLGAVFQPDWMLRLLGLDGKWRVSPFYFSKVLSAGVPYLIEHPKTTAIGAPGVLADKFQAHILMAHSHKVGMTTSRSGRWQGWHIGCCVDEERLPYSAQRHNGGHPHKLGAAIISNGVVYPLFDGWVDWAFLEGRA